MNKVRFFHEFIKKKVAIYDTWLIAAGFVLFVLLVAASYYYLYINHELVKQTSSSLSLSQQLAKTRKDYEDLKNQDQYKINQSQKTEIENINKTFKKAESEYQDIVDLDTQKGKTDPFKKSFAKILDYLSDRNYSSASADLTTLAGDIQKEKDRLAALLQNSSGGDVSVASLAQNNTPPGAGFSRQAVSANGETFAVDIIAADMGSTRIVVDTASDSDCHDNCPVLSLGDYVARSGAFAGVNGSYFCPADYPSCAGKSNSFDTLAMNKNKHYINSDNNVYSTVPAVIFLSGSMRFVGQSLEWGRDTGVDGVLANQPLLVSGGNVAFGGGSDPKQGSKGSRSFVANKGNTAYIGVAHNVTVAEMALVLKAMGMDNALNLDSGGSTALWSGGYKDGPGRNIPNAILFIRK
ncbi:MAG TPA: phosphodiester glycosidase family protein [Patescibacteria group bacterium]|nr:phosphodiester glycosidase family protein [Patescibacteria group bacterium]